MRRNQHQQSNKNNDFFGLWDILGFGEYGTLIFVQVTSTQRHNIKQWREPAEQFVKDLRTKGFSRIIAAEWVWQSRKGFKKYSIQHTTQPC